MTSFPLSRAARQKFGFFEPRFGDIRLARRLATEINLTRDLEKEPHRSVSAGTLAAASVLDEVFAHLIKEYVETVQPAALTGAVAYLEAHLPEKPLKELFVRLGKDFDAPSERPAAVEYAIRLRLANANDALGQITELFDDSVLPQPVYPASLSALHDYFETQPKIGPDDQSLLEFLFAPLRAFPDSIDGQLRYLLERGGAFVAPFLNRILLHLDILSEENKPIFTGPGPAIVPEWDRMVGMDEYEAFSQDKAWMPSVVLLAKNTYVWLDQLSKKFGHHIYRLDMVPDEELDEMASRGFSGLWLIGLWQRSKASQLIKQMCGNPDAVASAYSLHAYDIAWELGGTEAMDDLRIRAAQRGIRVASDMVPNHMAIDSRWVAEHPDWFLSLPQSPYPQYNYEGPDLSDDARCGIFLENHYYSKNDAAVVFKHVDNVTGEERFIYHGNDGTLMPWNDTAQLNYLMPEVREAVIQTILHVARQFPIIRFDAAMTLAKRHYHRLWFPAPGEGGAIPTRAGQGLTPDAFDAAMPEEFWREVVDRVATEVPETLLLAEAFWLMEGYFVRTLGMHRVYNSAFMNMLRDEKNAQYRQTLKNTLEFDPDILGRFVNFMNNPDEKTAVEQFGTGDKYFGIATLLATLPGLPMFGHGQIEGYAEKYGMEYPRAYWDEQPDEDLIDRHRTEIFPLLHHRSLFAGSDNFTLYDFWLNDGTVNENVFAYSNREGGERALIVYNNSIDATGGWIRSSVSFAAKQDGEKKLVQRSFGEALGIGAGEKSWCIFRDNTHGLEYLRRSRELVESGIFVQLNGYGCHVFLDWREVRDEAGLYKRLAEKLHGQGVPSVDLALREMLLAPIHAPFQQVADAALWKALVTATPAAKTESPFDELEKRLLLFGETACEFAGTGGEPAVMAKAARTRLEAALALLKPGRTKASIAQAKELAAPESVGTLVVWALASPLGLLGGSEEPASPLTVGERSRDWFDEWMLAPLFENCLVQFGLTEDAAERAVTLARVLVAHSAKRAPFGLVSDLLADSEAQKLLGINNYEGVIWFKQEGLEEVLTWLGLVAGIDATGASALPVDELHKVATASEYRVVKLLELTRDMERVPVPAPVVKKAAPVKKVPSKTPVKPAAEKKTTTTKPKKEK